MCDRPTFVLMILCRLTSVHVPKTQVRVVRLFRSLLSVCAEEQGLCWWLCEVLHIAHVPKTNVHAGDLVRSRLKPVLNWVNVSSWTWLEVFGEASWFLTGRTFLREPSWKYSSKLYSGSKKLRSTCSGNVRPIRRSLPLTGWEQSPPVDEETIKNKNGWRCR